MFSQLDRSKLVEDFVAAVDFVESHPRCTGTVGVLGFCFGGGIANQLAVRLPDLAAAVSFYGSQPATEDVVKIRTPLMLHYAELDERINAGWPAYETALAEAGIEYSAFVYEGTNHGFNNNTTPRFDEDAAALAWRRTIDFLDRYLVGRS